MNSLVEKHLELLHKTQSLRTQMFDILTDADLTYELPGYNPTLGGLCREMGETQIIYIQSFKTFKMEWGYEHPDKSVETDLEKLKAWFVKLDADLDAALTALSEDDLQNKKIDRGGWSPPVEFHFHVYREALLIYFAKASVYLKALQKPFPDQWRTWIA